MDEKEVEEWTVPSLTVEYENKCFEPSYLQVGKLEQKGTGKTRYQDFSSNAMVFYFQGFILQYYYSIMLCWNIEKWYPIPVA